MALLAVGMGNVMAPATDSIMGSLPRAKAGVGSAVNDTTRQMGGAVGVAVLGSLLASRYTSRVGAPARRRRAGAAAGRDQEGHRPGRGRAAQDPAAKPFAARISTAANASFVSGFHLAAIVAAGVIAVAAAAVVVWLPAKARDEEPEPGLILVPLADQPAPAIEVPGA